MKLSAVIAVLVISSAAAALRHGWSERRHVEPLTLSLSVLVGQEKATSSTSTFIYGGSEGILVDALYYKNDAARVADQIAATGRKLTAIIITHSDEDHYMGVSTVLTRFPGVPVYMTARSLERFKRNVAADIANLKKDAETETPDVTPTADVMPTTHFLVDGATVEVFPDLQGDVRQPSNSVVWVPSLRAIVAGDIVFSGVHPWLGNSTEDGRHEWQASLERMTALQPTIVVAGHKPNVDVKDGPESIAVMRDYLSAFDMIRKDSATADQLVVGMTAKFPKLALERFLAGSAKRAFPKAP